jgi:LacI family transcriptional regulator
MKPPRRIALALDVALLYKNHTGVFAGIQRYADEAGWHVLIDNWAEGTIATSPKGRPAYDGVIARITDARLGLVAAAKKRGVPLVNVMGASSVFDQVPGVFPDYEQCGRLQAEHLLAHGLRWFTFLTAEGSRPEVRQRAGFLAAIEAAGKSASVLNLPGTWDDSLAGHKRSQVALAQWLDSWRRPIGLAATGDDTLRVVMQMCLDRGWQIPADVAVVGTGNEILLCEQPRPSLSSVEVGFERVGYEAARLLDGLMTQAERDGKSGPRIQARRRGASPPAAPMHVTLPPVGIVVRDSTSSFLAEDLLVAEAQKFIASNCDRRMGVSTVAAKLSVSAKTLQKHFASALDRSVGQEIRRARIERVKRELAEGNRPIHEIAKRSGFRSNVSLSVIFRREVGLTPSQYRAQRSLPQRLGRSTVLPPPLDR